MQKSSCLNRTEVWNVDGSIVLSLKHSPNIPLRWHPGWLPYRCWRVRFRWAALLHLLWRWPQQRPWYVRRSEVRLVPERLRGLNLLAPLGLWGDVFARRSHFLYCQSGSFRRLSSLSPSAILIANPEKPQQQAGPTANQSYPAGIFPLSLEAWWRRGERSSRRFLPGNFLRRRVKGFLQQPAASGKFRRLLFFS